MCSSRRSVTRAWRSLCTRRSIRLVHSLIFKLIPTSHVLLCVEERG
jgi:hypothetical protein